MPEDAHILIVDDEDSMRHGLAECLADAGYRTSCCADVAAARELITREAVDLVITDLVMDGADGMVLLNWVMENHSHLPVIMITGYSAVDTAVEAMRSGAVDYIPKPFRVDEVRINVRRALENAALQRENRRLKRQLSLMQPNAPIIGESPLMCAALELVERIAPSDLSVLITGETGTGKELFARAIHRHSHRADRPLLSVNCAALPESLLESELFGHCKGAFTGAASAREGLFQAADGGTLFLDEIGDISPGAQARLLRVLQDGEIRRVGENRASTVDVRIIAATNQAMVERMRRREFREDLYHRLNVANVILPALRERRNDIPLLAEHFLHTARRQMGLADLAIEKNTIEILKSYFWPGNVRELANVMRRAAVVCRDATVKRIDLPDELVQPDGVSPGGRSLADVERTHVATVLEESGGNISLAARVLGISRPTLRSKIDRYGIKTRRDE